MKLSNLAVLSFVAVLLSYAGPAEAVVTAQCPKSFDVKTSQVHAYSFQFVQNQAAPDSKQDAEKARQIVSKMGIITTVVPAQPLRHRLILAEVLTGRCNYASKDNSVTARLYTISGEAHLKVMFNAEGRLGIYDSINLLLKVKTYSPTSMIASTKVIVGAGFFGDGGVVPTELLLGEAQQILFR